MKQGIRVVISAVVLTLVLAAVSWVGVPPALACDEEGSGLVSVRIDAPLTPENAAKIVFEEYLGTLTIKGIALNGTATWRDNDVEVLTGPVSIVGVILTTGDQTTYLDNRGILYLMYRFFDADGTTIIGTADGFVTLARVGDDEGDGSFQGTITIGGVAKQFAGTGSSEVLDLRPLPAPPPAPGVRLGASLCDDEEDGDCSDEQPGLSQDMEKTVLTGEKPGLAFETARSLRALNTQFAKEKTQLTRQRNQRLRVIRSVR